MTPPTSRIATLLLSLVGAGLGLLGWLLCGIGMVELGLLRAFDPFGAQQPPPVRTVAVHVAEWSFPIWALGAALLFPRFLRWVLRSPEEIREGR